MNINCLSSTHCRLDEIRNGTVLSDLIPASHKQLLALMSAKVQQRTTDSVVAILNGLKPKLQENGKTGLNSVLENQLALMDDSGFHLNGVVDISDPKKPHCKICKTTCTSFNNFLKIHSKTDQHQMNLKTFSNANIKVTAKTRSKAKRNFDDPTQNTVIAGMISSQFNIAPYQFPTLINVLESAYGIPMGNKNHTNDVASSIRNAEAKVLCEEFAITIKPRDAVNGVLDFGDIHGNRGYLAFVLIHTCFETKEQVYMTLPHHAYTSKTRDNIKKMMEKVVTEALDLCEETGIGADRLDFVSVDGGIFNTICTEAVEKADPKKGETASDMVKPRTAYITVAGKKIFLLWDGAHTTESAVDNAKTANPRIKTLFDTDKLLISYMNNGKNTTLFKQAKGVPNGHADSISNYNFTRFSAHLETAVNSRIKNTRHIHTVVKTRTKDADGKVRAKAIGHYKHLTSAYNTITLELFQKPLEIFRIFSLTSQETFVSSVHSCYVQK